MGFFKKKILFLALAVCVVFTTLSTEIVVSDNHDCMGKKCLVCLHSDIYKNTLKNAKSTADFLICPMHQFRLTEQKPEKIIFSFFLIEQKVCLNT